MELTINNLTKQFGDVRAVDGFSYAMTAGVYGLLGVNGAGKTTLMRMITTLLRPTSGEIRWDGQDIFACLTNASTTGTHFLNTMA